MREKILIAYATKFGSTAELAETIGEELSALGLETAVMPLKSVFDVTPYTAVIIGTPLITGKILPEVTEFVKEHQNMLHERPVLFFLAGYTLMDLSAERKQKAYAALEPVKSYVEVRSVGLFGGRVPAEGLSFVEKAAMKMDGIKPGDYRNTDSTKEWARSLVDLRLLHF